MASATRFTATAADLTRFFGQLSPRAETSILTAASRREMTRRHWRDAHSQLERYYGLGTISGPPGPWGWVGHAGAFQGSLTQTALLPEQNITISVLTNAVDGLAYGWLESVVHILKTIHDLGAPSPATANWRGRWWDPMGAVGPGAWRGQGSGCDAQPAVAFLQRVRTRAKSPGYGHRRQGAGVRRPRGALQTDPRRRWRHRTSPDRRQTLDYPVRSRYQPVMLRDG
jgi:hypothetical protein